MESMICFLTELFGLCISTKIDEDGGCVVFGSWLILNAFEGRAGTTPE